MVMSARPSAPRFEHHTDASPLLGVGGATSRLSWWVAEAGAGYRQTAYEIEITRDGGSARLPRREQRAGAGAVAGRAARLTGQRRRARQGRPPRRMEGAARLHRREPSPARRHTPSARPASTGSRRHRSPRLWLCRSRGVTVPRPSRCSDRRLLRLHLWGPGLLERRLGRDDGTKHVGRPAVVRGCRPPRRRPCRPHAPLLRVDRLDVATARARGLRGHRLDQRRHQPAQRLRRSPAAYDRRLFWRDVPRRARQRTPGRTARHGVPPAVVRPAPGRVRRRRQLCRRDRAARTRAGEARRPDWVLLAQAADPPATRRSSP